MTYQVRHRTHYTYESTVSSSYGEIHLLPRELDGQVCRTTVIEIEPKPHDYRERVDFFGNRVAYYSILESHRTLTVTATSTIDVSGRQATLPMLADQPWERVRDQLATSTAPEVVEARQFGIESPSVELSGSVAAYAAVTFTPGRALFDALGDLMHRIKADFDFSPGATSVTTSVDELLQKGAGVCQDFAHLAIACLRIVGLSARYVSGYLETKPPPGKARLVGADVSHAWVAAFVPGVGWVDFDPTNDQFVNERYITVGWGRDYSDVPPLKGVIYTEGAGHELEVTVDVVAT